MMAKTKSSEQYDETEAEGSVGISSVPVEPAERADNRTRRVPQMSTAWGRDGGRTQSGGVKGVIALVRTRCGGPELEPGPGPADPDDPDGDVNVGVEGFLSFFSQVHFRLYSCLSP